MYQAGKEGYLYCNNCKCLLSTTYPLQWYHHPTTTMHQEGKPVHQPPTTPVSAQFGPQVPMFFRSDHGGSVTMARPPPPGFPDVPYPTMPQQAQVFVDQSDHVHAQDHMDPASGRPPQVGPMPGPTNDVHDQPPVSLQHSPVLPEGHTRSAADLPLGSSSMETDPVHNTQQEIEVQRKTSGQTVVVIDTPPDTPNGESGGESKMEVSTNSPEGAAVSPPENKDKLQNAHNDPDPHVADQEPGEGLSDQPEANQTSPHVPDEASCSTPNPASPLSPDQGAPSPLLPEQASSSSFTVR